MPKKNRKIMDSVFKDLFGEDRDCKKNFISLYNALSGSDYKVEEKKMERKEIPQTVVSTLDNDVSWELNDRLIVLIEHQSTLNRNMPFRCLEYVTRLYETIIESRSRYGSKLLKLPTPDFYVVYAGDRNAPQKKILKLSDSFYLSENPKLELTVTVLNCSNPENLPMQKDCDIIKQYRQFVQIVRQKYDPLNPVDSIRDAINSAKRKGILTDYLTRKEPEVTNMLCAEYDYDTDIAVKQEEAAEERAIQDATNFLKENIPVETIARCVCLPLELVKELKNKLDAQG